jgi:transcriptional antiterminator RfaH
MRLPAFLLPGQVADPVARHHKALTAGMSDPTSTQTVNAWMIAQLKPGGGAAALRNLHRQGFLGFLPRLGVIRRASGRPVPGVEPLFPGYLFVLDRTGAVPVNRISHTLGIARLLLTADRQPAQMPGAFMDALLARCDDQGVYRPDNDLRPGTAVRIMQGAFADQVTEVQSLSPNGRVAVLIRILGAAREVHLSPADIMRTDVILP